MLFLRLPSSTCLLRALRFCLPFLPRWLHATSKGLLRAPPAVSRRYIWMRYNEECFFFGCLLPPAFLEHPISVSIFCRGGFTPSQQGSLEPPCRLRGDTSGGGTMKTAISLAASFTCLLRALHFSLPFLPRWLHAISTGLHRTPLPVFEEVHLDEVQ